jgi:hypothetical protein
VLHCQHYELIAPAEEKWIVADDERCSPLLNEGSGASGIGVTPDMPVAW